MLLNRRKFLRILMMMVSLLDSACFTISDVAKDWLSIISCMKMSFAGDGLEAISPWSQMVLSWEDLVIVTSRRMGDEGRRVRGILYGGSCKIYPSPI